MQSKADLMGEGSSLLENDIAFVPTHATTSGSGLCNNFIANLDETWDRDEMKARIPVRRVGGAWSY
jgi:hypothetical protein